jgi:hypothetical protein
MTHWSRRNGSEIQPESADHQHSRRLSFWWACPHLIQAHLLEAVTRQGSFALILLVKESVKAKTTNRNNGKPNRNPIGFEKMRQSMQKAVSMALVGQGSLRGCP